MPVTARQTTIADATPEELWAWHARPEAFERLVPPWQDVQVAAPPGGLVDGATARLAIRARGRTWGWTSTLHDVDPPRGFDDVTTGAPLAHWRHAHRFRAVPGGTVLDDAVDWALAGPARLATAGFGRDLERLLAWRHRTTADDLADHRRHADRPRLRIGITGATGLVGAALARFLTTGGHEVVPFVRRAPRPGEVAWDPDGAPPDPHALRALDALVHLAGAPIAAGRWTEERKRAIRDSRVHGTRVLAQAIARAGGPKVLVSASAFGFWGSPSTVVDETSPAGDGFLAEVAVAWEAAADAARDAGVRVVHPRVGLVLSARGGILGTLAPLVRCGLGGVVGSGRQGMPWIALDDMVAVLHEAVMDERLVGPVAAVAPAQDDNATFMHALGRVLGRPTLAHVPAFAVDLLLGEQGREVLLSGPRVRPARLLELGYRWRHTTLDDALRWELGRFEP